MNGNGEGRKRGKKKDEEGKRENGDNEKYTRSMGMEREEEIVKQEFKKICSSYDS